MPKKASRSRQIKIYCLVDPRNNRIFYVGATACKLKVRLSAHCHVPGFSVGAILKKKQKLITEIAKEKARPLIVELKVVDFLEVDYWEQYYYYLFKGYGFELLQAEYQFQYCVNKKAA